MLTIYKKQMSVFSGYMRQSFEKNAAVHLRKKYTLKTEAITNKGLEDLIKKGINKAATYNIIEREDVLSYFEFMIYFGDDFDVNPSTAWAAKILKIRNLSGTEKIKRLVVTNPPIPKTE